MKRLFDIILSLLSLPILIPILIGLGTAIVLTMGFPVLFTQTRPGYQGRPFKFYKFRTMTFKKNEQQEFLPDKDRLTRFGIILRRTSLDELPSIWNVLKGDMSLVGPRPLLVEYLNLYAPEQARRHNVKPGITGWAQINGRNAISWEEKFKLDVWYVDNRNFLLDLKILLMTIKKVLKSEGITQEGQATAERFRGGK